jgi:integrase
MVRQELKAWRDTPVAALRRRDVIELLDAIVECGAPVLANRVLSLISKVLNFGINPDWLESSVAAKMPKPTAEQSRSRVLTEDEIKVVCAHPDKPAPKDENERLWTLTRAALKLRFVTAQRGREVITMRWSDIDGSLWTIPADVAKNKLPHRVWLSASALTTLSAVKARTVTSDAQSNSFVFAGTPALGIDVERSAG